MHATKIAIIGTGYVGSATAFACMMRNIASEIMLVDVDITSCTGQTLDLSDALPFSSAAAIKMVTYKEAAQADIIIITAGKSQLEGQTRQELLQANKTIIKSIISELGQINHKAIIVMVTNPVDTLTWYAQQLINLPPHHIIGSGTALDSQRLRNLISQEINIAEQSIHAYIIGEHGDNQVAALSAGTIAGLPLTQFLPIDRLKEFALQAKQKAYEIIRCKKYTNYGIAASVAAICENIVFDTHRILPISCYQEEYDICMSLPAVLGSSGVKKQLKIPLDQTEEQALQNSIISIKTAIKGLN